LRAVALLAAAAHCIYVLLDCRGGCAPPETPPLPHATSSAVHQARATRCLQRLLVCAETDTDYRYHLQTPVKANHIAASCMRGYTVKMQQH
jgi:hypothetical protein